MRNTFTNLLMGLACVNFDCDDYHYDYHYYSYEYDYHDHHDFSA